MLVFPATLTMAVGVPTLKANYLRCEYLTNPIGVDVRQPRLSWELHGTGRGVRQTAFRILVATRRSLLQPGRADLWDTGKVPSSASCQVPYGGRELPPLSRAFWTVQVWDEHDRPAGWSDVAEWTTGPGERWVGQWIGDPTDYPPGLPARNGYHSEMTANPDTEKWVVVEMEQPTPLDGVRLWPARPYDWPDTPAFLFPLRFRLEGSATAADPFEVLADHTDSDTPSPGTKPLVLRFPRRSLQRIRLVVTRLRQRDAGNYGLALAEMEGLDGSEVRTRGARVTTLDSIETGPWAAANLTDGDTVSHPAKDEPLPPIFLRREFVIEQKPARALLFASALGVYEVRINGQRVGDHVLAPEWTDYRTRVQYQGYDVTHLLRKGKNVIAAIVGDGWYAGRIGLFPGRGHYGRRPEFLAQLHTEGSPAPLLVTDNNWRLTTEGPIRSSDILDGEVYDARMEMPGWDLPGFRDEGWISAAAFAHDRLSIIAQPNEPIRVTHELVPVGLTEPLPGHYVFDMGQNMVGWIRMRLEAPAGTVVRFRHAEVLNEDGTIYTDNLRGAPQGDWYTCHGKGEEVFEPHFTYHGFRYVEVTGLPGKPSLGDLVGRVFHSSAPEVGTFTCSDESLNRLWLNILWTQRANLMSTPTDCPQRDERLGWMGDIQAFGRTATFNMDLAAFFTKWLRDVRDAQADDGRFPDFAPNPADSNKSFSGSPAWGDAGVIVPWLVYETYGDRRLIEDHYPAVVRWIEFIRTHNPDLIWRNRRYNDYNDWLNGDTLIADGWPTKGAEVPREVFATAFWANSTRLASEMARVLGKTDEAERWQKLFEGIRTAFNQAFVTQDGRVLGDTQAGYALALHFDLLPEELRSLAVRHMITNIEGYGWHLSTGIQSTHRMMLELTRAGRSDLAYRLLLNRTFPSWLYTIDNGATTVWERWDGYVRGRGFQNPGMNSFNHWALGAVGEWMMRTIVGLNPGFLPHGDRQTVWQHCRIEPRPGGGLQWARGSYRSIHGEIGVAWRSGADGFSLGVTLPPNCSARVRLPGAGGKSIAESGRPLAQSDGVTVEGRDDEDVIIRIGSGTYRFSYH